MPEKEPQTIFHAALSLTGKERSAYLDIACQGQPQMRNAVESLILAHDEANQFMEGQHTTDGSWLGEIEQQQIDRYRLLEQIGEGGFGVVYMAEQVEPIQRRVAVKIIKPGMDTKQVIARFEAERQALALMDHSNIAKVLDAGKTEMGRPYFVMELVRGIPVTEYCDDRRLPTAERLHLFTEICSAVQHAHQKGIIHRDIKPSNILVSTNGDVPVPKVIDFGIAKATQGRLTEKTLFTQFRQFIGTPVYMSPEQAQMSAVDVDTRSDIYALGVLLYELLTGTTPFDPKELLQGGFDEVCRRIREEEPPKPSTRLNNLTEEEQTTVGIHRQTDHDRLRHSIRGDLDWIVTKSMEKDRSRRYATAEALAQDIERHLNGEVVTAAPPSKSYLIRKLVRRNRGLLATGGAFAAVLVIASIFSSWWAYTANKAGVELTEANKTIHSALDAANEAKDLAAAERSRAERIAYASDMKGADQSLQLNNMGLASFYVERNLPGTDGVDLRNWEWRALWRLTRGNAVFRFGEETDRYESLAISTNGKWLATGEQRGTIQVWNLESRHPVKKLTSANPRMALYEPSLAFSSADDRLYGTTTYFDQSRNVSLVLVKSWIAPSFEQTEERIELGGEHASICISHDGSRLATLCEDEIAVWQLPTSANSKPLLVKKLDEMPPAKDAVSLAFSPQGDRLAVGLHKGTLILDAENLKAIVPAPKTPHIGRNHSIRFSPDGEFLATRDQHPGNAFWLIDARSGEVHNEFREHSQDVTDIVFSSGGDFFATASADSTIRIWNTQTLDEEAVMQGHKSEVRCLAYTPDGRHLISAGIGEICVWETGGHGATDWPTTRDIVPYQYRYRQHSQASFSHNMRWLATQNKDPRGNTWDFHGEPRYSVSVRTPDTLEEKIRLTDVGDNVRGVRFSPVADILAVGDSDGQLSLVSLETQHPHISFREKIADLGIVNPVGFSRDGKRLLLIIQQPNDTKCMVWSVTDNRDIQSWILPSIEMCAAISPGGQVVVTGHLDGTVRLWQVSDPADHHEIPFHRVVSSVAFSPDGEQLAVGAHELHILNASTYEPIGKMLGHKGAVHSVDYSPDGSRIVTGGGGSTEAVKVWDVATLQELMTLTTEGGWHGGFTFREVEFSPNGDSIMAIGGFNKLYLWRAPTLEQVDEEIASSSRSSSM